MICVIIVAITARKMNTFPLSINIQKANTKRINQSPIKKINFTILSPTNHNHSHLNEISKYIENFDRTLYIIVLFANK